MCHVRAATALLGQTRPLLCAALLLCTYPYTHMATLPLHANTLTLSPRFTHAPWYSRYCRVGYGLEVVLGAGVW